MGRCGPPRNPEALGETCPVARAARSPDSPSLRVPQRPMGPCRPKQGQATLGPKGLSRCRGAWSVDVCVLVAWFNGFPFPLDKLLTMLLLPQFPVAPLCWWSSPPTSTSVASANSSSITLMPSLGISKVVASSLARRPGPPARSSLCRKKRCHQRRHRPQPGQSLQRPKP